MDAAYIKVTIEQKQARVENVLTQHIDITPGVVGGRPRMISHRITFQTIVIWHERR